MAFLLANEVMDQQQLVHQIVKLHSKRPARLFDQAPTETKATTGIIYGELTLVIPLFRFRR